jgi:hypothetical protein
MKQPQTREIDGHTYVVTLFPGRRGFKLKTTLLKKLGPGLAAMIGSAKGESVSEADLDGPALAAGVETLFANLGSPDEIMSLIEKIVSMTRRDGKEITGALIDLEFPGHFTELYKVVWFVLEVNFGDFFGGAAIGGLGGLIKARITDSLSGSGKGSIKT